MDHLTDAVEKLGDPAARRQAYDTLVAAKEDGIPAACEGLTHNLISVRKLSAFVLDRIAVTEPARHALVHTALHDPNRKVRAAAVHSLGCDHCKPEDACGTEVDVVGVAIQVLQSDPSGRVRRAAAGALHGKIGQQRIVDALDLALDDPDEKVRGIARWVLGKYAGAA